MYSMEPVHGYLCVSRARLRRRCVFRASHAVL